MVKIADSRYGNNRNITNNGHGMWTINGKPGRYRIGMNKENTEIAYFDPEGGPMIHVGDDLGFGKISEIFVEKAEEGHFKVRLQVES